MEKQDSGPIAPHEASRPVRDPEPRFNRQTSMTSQPLPGRRLGAMDQQSGLAIQASRSSPQQFVQLVGHRNNGETRFVRPHLKNSQMGSFEPDTPIG